MRLQPLNRFGRWGVFQQPAKRSESHLSWQKIIIFLVNLNATIKKTKLLNDKRRISRLDY